MCISLTPICPADRGKNWIFLSRHLMASFARAVCGIHVHVPPSAKSFCLQFDTNINTTGDYHYHYTIGNLK
jgi:hypothetical protein